MRNPGGEKLTWDFVRAQWAAIEKRGAALAAQRSWAGSEYPARSASRRRATRSKSFSLPIPCRHERALKESLERIDLKARQEPALAPGSKSRAAGQGSKHLSFAQQNTVNQRVGDVEQKSNLIVIIGLFRTHSSALAARGHRIHQSRVRGCERFRQTRPFLTAWPGSSGGRAQP